MLSQQSDRFRVKRGREIAMRVEGNTRRIGREETIDAQSVNGGATEDTLDDRNGGRTQQSCRLMQGGHEERASRHVNTRFEKMRGVEPE